MIRHIVFFTIRHEKDRQTMAEGLGLLTAIPHGFTEICTDLALDTISERIDFIVAGTFADEAELAAYKAHPLYQKSIEIVRPLRLLRLAADF